MKQFLLRYRLPLWVGVFTIASILGINQYHYGMWNHFVSLPWLQDMLNPELYPGDILVAQREQTPTFYYQLLYYLLPLTGYSIPGLFLSLYIVALYATFYAFYALGYLLFAQERAGIITLIMGSFAFPVIADIFLWDSLLLERSLALPLLLWSIYCALRQRLLTMALLMGLAFLLHPLSATFVVIATGLGLLVSRGLTTRLLLAAGLFLVLSAPIFYNAYLHLVQASAGNHSEAWMQVMKLRNAHHAFPSAYHLDDWLKSLLLLLFYFPLIHFSAFNLRWRRFLYGFGGGVILMLITGLVFTEIVPVKFIIQLQLFRSFRFLIILSLVVWGGLIVCRPRPVYYLLGAGVILQYWYIPLDKTLSAWLLVIITWLVARFWSRPQRLYLLTGAFYLFLGIAGFILRGDFRAAQGSQSPHWYDVQHWFRENTPVATLAITPPQEPGFRVESLRSCYGSWYEGTRAFFNESYAERWLSHMHKLHCYDPNSLVRDYRGNDAATFLKIWEEERESYQAGYIVQYRHAKLDLPQVYSNEDFAIYALPGSPSPGQGAK